MEAEACHRGTPESWFRRSSVNLPSCQLAHIWNLCRSRGGHRLNTKPPRAGKRESDDSAHPSAPCGMDEVVPPVPEEPFDADVSRDGHDSVLRPSFLQRFAVGNRSDSPRVSVPLSSRPGPVSSKRRGPNLKGPEGLGTLGARELEGPVAVDPRACPRIGTQPTRPLRDVNGDPPDHRCVFTSRRDRVAERKQLGSATPGSGITFDQWALHLFASKTQQHDDTSTLDSSSRPWLGPLVNLIARTRKRDEKLFSFHRCVAQGTARCRSEASGGIFGHHTACDAPFWAEQRQGVTLQDNRRSPEAGQVARLFAARNSQHVSHVWWPTFRRWPLPRFRSTLEKYLRTMPETCTAHTFAKRCRGSPHIQALKGRTAVVLMDAGAPFAKPFRRLGLVVALLSSGNSANAAGP